MSVFRPGFRNTQLVGDLDARLRRRSTAAAVEAAASIRIAKCLGSRAPSAATDEVLYSVPVARGAVAHSLWIANRGAAGTIRVGAKVGGGGALANEDYLLYELGVAANDSFYYATDQMLCLSALDEMIVRASTANFTFKLFGEEIPENTTLRCLGSSAPAATTETVLYTVPTAMRAFVHSLWICNRGAMENVDFGVSVGGGALANDDYLFKSVVANGTLFVGSGRLLCLAALDEIRVNSALGNVTYKVFGEEGVA